MENQFNNTMNPPPANPAPEIPPPVIAPTLPPKKSGVGAVIGSAIVIILLILGALYFWGEKLSEQEQTPVQNNSVSATDAVVEKLNQQSSSDDLSSIEADLNATEWSNPEEGLGGLE